MSHKTVSQWGFVVTLGMVVLLLQSPRSAAQEEGGPGNCSENRHSSLYAPVSWSCKGGGVGQRCHTGMSCGELRENKGKQMACFEARSKINNECFGGGNPGHQQKQGDAWNAALRCDEAIREKKC